MSFIFHFLFYQVQYVEGILLVISTNRLATSETAYMNTVYSFYRTSTRLDMTEGLLERICSVSTQNEKHLALMGHGGTFRVRM